MISYTGCQHYESEVFYKWLRLTHYIDVIMSAMASQNHQPHDCLFNRLFRRRSKKTSKLRVTGLCELKMQDVCQGWSPTAAKKYMYHILYHFETTRIAINMAKQTGFGCNICFHSKSMCQQWTFRDTSSCPGYFQKPNAENDTKPKLEFSISRLLFLS